MTAWPQRTPDEGAPASESRTVLFIAGAGHSGSTMLSQVLNNHPDVFSIGEMHAPEPVVGPKRPEQEQCSCGARIGDCPFMTEVARRLRAEGIDFEPVGWNLEYTLHPHPRVDQLLVGSLRSNALEAVRDALSRWVPGHGSRLRDLDHRVERFMHHALDVMHARVFVDASKNATRIRHLRRLRGFRLKVLHLVRDPRGVVYSYRKQPRENMDRAADGWVSSNRAVDRVGRLLPEGDLMRLRYEDFCRDPAAALETLCGFVGVDPLDVPSDIRGVEHHVQGGNASRLTSDPRAAIRLDEKWREGLDPERMAATVARAGPLARRYGYAI